MKIVKLGWKNFIDNWEIESDWKNWF